MATVKTPERWLTFFGQAEELVRSYFADKVEDAENGCIFVGPDRYVLVRAESLSVELYRMMSELYDGRDEEAHAVVRSMLFHIAHFIGRSDAKHFHRRLGLQDPIAKLSAGVVHFAHVGWASVEILPESHPVPNEDFLLVYDHVYSFESESWTERGASVQHPACFMSAGYSSGWCEASFRVPLVATELTCTAKGDRRCRFVMAHPSKIGSHIRKYLDEHPKVAEAATAYEVPGEPMRAAFDDRFGPSCRATADGAQGGEVREIASEFQALLAGIRNDLDLLGTQLGERAGTSEPLHDAKLLADRATGLMRQLESLSSSGQRHVRSATSGQ